MEWQEALKEYLIHAGTIGKTKTEILRKFQVHANAVRLTEELEYLLSESKVQRFEIQGHGPPKEVWRATTKILER